MYGLFSCSSKKIEELEERGESLKSLFIAEKPIENFLVSAIIYPTSCLERRFLSTRPMHNLTFSLHPKIGEYHIWDHQEICFWHAIAPNNRTIIINYDTEEMFDVIRVYTSGKRSVELSGIGTKYYKTDTPIFFHWSSDHLNLSNYFSISSSDFNILVHNIALFYS